MPYDVTIKDTVTQESRVCPFDLDWTDSTAFLWEEGNYSCDCNRSLFFAQAAGEADGHQPCGDTRYVVTSIVSNGQVVYDSEE